MLVPNPRVSPNEFGSALELNNDFAVVLLLSTPWLLPNRLELPNPTGEPSTASAFGCTDEVEDFEEGENR